MADTVPRPAGGVESLAHRLHAHAPSHATHTIEMQQVIEINRYITAGVLLITAAEIGVDDLPRSAAAGASLRHLHIEGSPTFPYVFAVFELPGSGPDGHGVPLHTQHLQAISKALHLHHHWGP